MWKLCVVVLSIIAGGCISLSGQSPLIIVSLISLNMAFTLVYHNTLAKGTAVEFWELDFTSVYGNEAVRQQGKLHCIRTATKGFFSPELERYPSRQDLAVKRKIK